MEQLSPSLINLFIIVFGLVIGSFLNVVIYRLPRERSIVRPPSACAKCHEPIAWHENIPLISFLILRGRCSQCDHKISVRYPLVEALTAFLFLLTWRGTGLDVAQFRNWFFVSIGIAITCSDLDFRIIPDELSLGGWVIGALTAYWDGRNEFWPLILASLLGFGAFFAFGLIYEKITGRSGLGGGDVKFMGTIGVFLGFAGIWSTLMISSILGSGIGLAYGYWQKRKEGTEHEGALLRSAIPFGPFLVFGALVELIYEVSRWMIH